MPQYAVPQADPAGTVSAGGWEEDFGGGTDLADQVNNGIEGGTPNGDSIKYVTGSTTCELLLESLTDPDDDSNHTIRVDCNNNEFLGSATLTVAIFDGATSVFSTDFTVDNSESRHIESADLTSYPNNYNDLRVKLTCSSNFVQVYEVELEVPSAGGGGGGDVEDPTNPEAFLMFL